VSAGRIAVVLPSRETFTRQKSGAVALCARDFARFSRYAAQIDILGAGDCDYGDVSYRRLEGWRRWLRRDRDAYARAVAAEVGVCALVEVQNRPLTALALRRAHGGAKLALHLHNDPQTMDGSRRLSERARLIEACDAIYCVSDFVRRRLLEGLADPADKAVTIHNGVVLGGPSAAKEPIVAFTGRIIAAKGVAELVRAFAAAGLEGWRLVIAGGDPDGLLRGLRRERAALGDRFGWLGQVSHAEALALLGRAEIAAAPSVWDEPFGRAAVEAMAAGAALAASRRGALPEVCGEAAVFVEPGDVRGFAAALRRLAGDETYRRRLQAAGRARAAAAFAIERTAARLDAARAGLLGEA